MLREKFYIQEISDEFIRENFRKLQMLMAQPVLRGRWKFFTFEISSAVTNKKLPHLLGFVPKDVLVTYQVGAGVPTFNYTLFDRETIDITTTGPCSIRAFIGRYEEEV